MNIAIDISPIKDAALFRHKIRGTGVYISNLQSSLLKYYPENNYFFFQKKEKLPTNLDIIHYPYFEPFFLSLPFKNTDKAIVTVHDLTPLVFTKNFPSGIKGKLNWFIQKNNLKRVRGIITDSEASKKDIIKLTGIKSEKIFVVYLAASDKFKVFKKNSLEMEKIRKKYNLPEKFALYVGDVTWNKNLPLLVQAILNTNIPIVMVGKALVSSNFNKKNPWNKDLSIVQAETEKNKQFIFTGFVSDEDLSFIYNLATLFVMPSLYEGFGLPILEAMKCGCPVVTTKEGSIPEVAGNAAYYVNAYSSQSISNGIKEVFFNVNLKNRLSKEGILQANKFSWEITTKKTVNIYEKFKKK